MAKVDVCLDTSGLFAADGVSGSVAERVGLKLNESVHYLICSEVSFR